MIVNTNEFKKAFITLGWDNLSLSEFEEWLKNAGINPAHVLALCRALITSPDGVDETAVSGGPTDQERPYVLEYLKGKGVIV